MIYAGIDIETTGLDKTDHRIIEVYVGLWKPDGTRIFAFEQRIDPQRSIGADAMRIHNITPADLVGKPVFAAVAPKLQKVMAKADIYVWHNGDEFDGPFMAEEFRRAGMMMPKKPSIDTQDAVWATPDGKKPKLQELTFACGVEYDTKRAHAASYDVEVMMQAFFKAHAWGYFAQEEAA